MKISLSALGTEPTAAPTELPITVTLASQHGLPADVVDELWSRNLVAWDPTRNTPCPPSAQVAAQLVETGSRDVCVALASSVRDNDVIARACARFDDAIPAAATNPWLLPSLCDDLAAISTDERIAARVAVRQLLADAVSTGTSDVSALAGRLLEASEAIVIADLIEGVDMGVASPEEEQLASELESALSSIEWGSKGRVQRSTRAAVLVELSERHCEAFERIAISTIVRPGAALDPGLVLPLQHLLESGMLSGDQIAATFDTDAAAWAGFIPEIVPFIPAELKAVTSTPSSSISSQLDALSLLGLSSVGARTALMTGATLSPEMLDELFADADIDTIVDWAEHRLAASRPAPGEVAHRLLTADSDLLSEIAVEVGRRPEPLSSNGELALCLPGTTAAPASAARAVRIALQEKLGDDITLWVEFLDLLEHRNDLSVAAMIAQIA